MSALSATKSAIFLIKDLVIDDFRDHPIDTAPWLNAAIYLSAMLFIGVTGWKALVVVTVILFAIMYNYGRRTLIRGGMAILFFSLAVWAEIIPDPARWGQMARSIVTELRR